MRPITDDVVLGLLKGLETREKRALAKRAKHVVTTKSAFRSRKVVSLGEEKIARRARRTSRGLFSYITTD